MTDRERGALQAGHCPRCDRKSLQALRSVRRFYGGRPVHHAAGMRCRACGWLRFKVEEQADEVGAADLS